MLECNNPVKMKQAIRTFDDGGLDEGHRRRYDQQPDQKEMRVQPGPNDIKAAFQRLHFNLSAFS
jgi:hypothetical protein